MSHIPNSAMPHAGDTASLEPLSHDGHERTLYDRAGMLAERARAHPRVAAAAGAAVLAGAVAAAALPMMRRRRSSSSSSSSGKSHKSAKKG